MDNIWVINVWCKFRWIFTLITNIPCLYAVYMYAVLTLSTLHLYMDLLVLFCVHRSWWWRFGWILWSSIGGIRSIYSTRPHLHRAESAFCANRYVGHSQLISYCIIYQVFSFCIVHGKLYSCTRVLSVNWPLFCMVCARWATSLTQILHIHKHTNRDALDILQLLMICIFHVFNSCVLQGCKYVGDVELLKNPPKKREHKYIPEAQPHFMWSCKNNIMSLKGIVTCYHSFRRYTSLDNILFCRIFLSHFCNLQSDHVWTDQFDGVLSQVSGPHFGYCMTSHWLLDNFLSPWFPKGQNPWGVCGRKRRQRSRRGSSPSTQPHTRKWWWKLESMI